MNNKPVVFHSEYVQNTVLRLWASSEQSASEIGLPLGITRNSVISLMNRLGGKLGLTSREAFRVAWAAPQAVSDKPRERIEQGASMGRYVPKPVNAGRSNEERAGRRRKGFRTEAMLRAKAPSPQAKLPPAREYDLSALQQPSESGFKSLFEIKHGECRAVVADHPSLPGGLYCAAPVWVRGAKHKHTSYCEEHHKLYYVPVKSTKQERTRKVVSTFRLRMLGTGVRA
jgi:hypothetical protein